MLDISEYDVIIGYRADDSYFSFAQDFVAGVISLQKLSEAMQLGKLGEQIVLKSPQAFEKIQYVKSEPVDMQAYYIKKIERERAARKEYRMSKRQKADLNELFILDIMRGMEAVIHAYSEDYLNHAQKYAWRYDGLAAVNTVGFLRISFMRCFWYRMCQCSFRQEIRLMWQERPGVNW
ncbi:MAG: DUF3990 domain-containing protein [Blautia faecis]